MSPAIWGPTQVWHFRLTVFLGAKPAQPALVRRVCSRDAELNSGKAIYSLSTHPVVLSGTGTVFPPSPQRQQNGPARTKKSSRDAGPHHLQVDSHLPFTVNHCSPQPTHPMPRARHSFHSTTTTTWTLDPQLAPLPDRVFGEADSFGPVSMLVSPGYRPLSCRSHQA